MKKALRLAAAPLAFISLLSACGPSPEEILARAGQAYAENRFNEARLDLGTLIRGNPDDVHILELLARTQLQLGDGDGAEATLLHIEQIGVKSADHDLLMGEAQLLLGHYDAVTAMFAEPQSADEGRLAGLAQVGLGENASAAAIFVSALELPGTKSRLQSDYALLLLQSGEMGRARELIQAARAVDPEALDPLLAEARLGLAQRKPAEALAAFELAQSLFPESRAALLGRIGVLGDLGRIAEAGDLIDEATRRAPADPQVIYLEARLEAENSNWNKVRELLQTQEGSAATETQLLYSRSLVELGLFEQAISRLTPLHQRLPQAPAIRRLLGRAQLEADNPGDALQMLQPLVDNPAGSPSDLTLYARAANESNNPSAAAAIFTQIPAAERLARHLSEGDAALREGKWRTAIESYEQIRQWTGDSNALVLNNLAYARSQVGDKQAALRLAETALGLAPEHPLIMDTLGWLLFETGGNRRRALDLLQEAARRAPDNAAITQHLNTIRAS